MKVNKQMKLAIFNIVLYLTQLSNIITLVGNQ